MTNDLWVCMKNYHIWQTFDRLELFVYSTDFIEFLCMGLVMPWAFWACLNIIRIRSRFLCVVWVAIATRSRFTPPPVLDHPQLSFPPQSWPSAWHHIDPFLDQMVKLLLQTSILKLNLHRYQPQTSWQHSEVRDVFVLPGNLIGVVRFSSLANDNFTPPMPPTYAIVL